MLLELLELTDFRNFNHVKVALPPRLSFFVGDNGQGKTNLIEAVHMLSRGVSFRPADSHNFVNQIATRAGHERAKLLGRFSDRSMTFATEILISPGKRSASINGKRANSADLMREFPTVLFSPESLAAIKEGPDQRRQLIDEILLSHDPKQGKLLREQQRALKARNRLLRNIARAVGPRREQEDALESLNKIYFVMSAHLASARIEALKAIEEDFRVALTLIMGDDAERSSLDYLISDHSAMGWSDSQVFDAMRERHRELANSEMNYGSSLVGPHKHDIKILFAGNDSRFYCSQGQQRALILALKIAQIVYHHKVHQTYPVLLLDDVLSELDAKKRVNLMKFLESISAQTLITSTDLAWSDQFSADRNSIFAVAHGCVTAVKF